MILYCPSITKSLGKLGTLYMCRIYAQPAVTTRHNVVPTRRRKTLPRAQHSLLTVCVFSCEILFVKYNVTLFYDTKTVLACVMCKLFRVKFVKMTRLLLFNMLFSCHAVLCMCHPVLNTVLVVLLSSCC